MCGNLMGALTQSRLKEVLRYDPETGGFIWLVTLSNRAPAGTVAGTTASVGTAPYKIPYRLIAVDGVLHRAGRLAWLYVNGEFPAGILDHINCDSCDDRITNLREASTSESVANTRLSRRNTSGFKGVYYHKEKGRKRRWEAYIGMNGRHNVIGYYDTPEEAHEAYKAVAEKRWGEFARADKR